MHGINLQYFELYPGVGFLCLTSTPVLYFHVPYLCYFYLLYNLITWRYYKSSLLLPLASINDLSEGAVACSTSCAESLESVGHGNHHETMPKLLSQSTVLKRSNKTITLSYFQNPGIDETYGNIWSDHEFDHSVFHLQIILCAPRIKNSVTYNPIYQ